MRTIRSAIALIGVGVLATTGLLSTSTGAQTVPDNEPAYWEVTDLTPEEVLELLDSGFDVTEYHDGTADIVGDTAMADELRERGLDPEYRDSVYKPVEEDTFSTYSTYYGGYKTPDEHLQHVDNVAASNPNLATAYDIGDSWLKTQNQGGHDIKAICITNKQPGDCELDPNSTKPRLSVVSQVHAREIATGEITWRWIDYLVDNYGTDSQVTELLDTTEIWVVPIANPDGVDIVASGGNNPIMQRKNAHNYGSCSGTGKGVDLNRNHSYRWGDASSNPCAETYRGPSSRSEPETDALEGLFEAIHPDQRGPGDNDPAPSDTRDVMISLHAYGNYIIVPWGYGTANPPNNDGLRALGNEMSQSNGYSVGNAYETVGYTASGTTDDYTYGTMGIASYTFEIGSGWGNCGGFFPAYSCIDNTLWPQNRGALMTAALAADAPYGDGGTDPQPPEGCENFDAVESGSLSGTGNSGIHPDGSYYYSGSSGQHQGCLSGPTNADFDFSLQKWSGNRWQTVADSTGPTSEESVNYSGSSGYFRWVVNSYSGSGAYTMGYNRP